MRPEVYMQLRVIGIFVATCCCSIIAVAVAYAELAGTMELLCLYKLSMC